MDQIFENITLALAWPMLGFQNVLSSGPSPNRPPVQTASPVGPVSGFNFDKYSGDWTEVARSNNSFQNTTDPTYHRFSNQAGPCYTITQGDNRAEHRLVLKHDEDGLHFNCTNGQIWKNNSKLRLYGLYDNKLAPVTNHSTQPYCYSVLGQGDQTWVLAKKGYETEAPYIRRLISYCQTRGRPVNVHKFGPGAPTPLPSKPVAQETPKAEDYLIPWTRSAFPPGGHGRVLNVKAGQVIRFKTPKEDTTEHTVAMASLYEDEDAPQGRKWGPHPNPDIPRPKACAGFNQTLTLEEPGVYYLVCPLNENHKTMRLKVVVDDPAIKVDEL